MPDNFMLPKGDWRAALDSNKDETRHYPSGCNHVRAGFKAADLCGKARNQSDPVSGWRESMVYPTRWAQIA